MLHGSSKTNFTFKCSDLHNFLNIQWKCMIRVAVSSARNDLSKPYHDFSNCKNRILTSWSCRSRFRWLHGLEVENRWPMMIRKMTGMYSLAQQCSMMKNFQTAMDEQGFNRCDFFKFLPPIAFNSCSITPASEDQHERKQKEWWILDEQVKKSVRKIERIWRIFALDLRKWLWIPNFCYD